MPQVRGRAEPAGLGPWQPGSPLCASLRLCPGCRSLPAALGPCARPAVVTILNTYDPARHRKATPVRSGWEGKGRRWPEELGHSRGWLYAERPGAWQGGEAASLGCVCGTGDHAGAATVPPSCSHPAPTMTLGAMLADARPGGTLRGIREQYSWAEQMSQQDSRDWKGPPPNSTTLGVLASSWRAGGHSCVPSMDCAVPSKVKV